MTTSFYVPPERIIGGRFSLPEDEAQHAARVLRMSPGDEIVLVDGVGGWYRGMLDHVDKRRAGGHILEAKANVGEPSFDLTVGMALVKNRGRFETFLEKAVELGVSTVVPLITERTEKQGLREQRAESILTAAMKQCGRCRLTTIAPPVAIRDFLSGAGSDLGICCHEGAGLGSSIMTMLRDLKGTTSIRLLIGPEGGFTDAEVREASAAGYRIASLGPRRLRAETAAIAATAAVSLALEAAQAPHEE